MLLKDKRIEAKSLQFLNKYVENPKALLKLMLFKGPMGFFIDLLLEQSDNLLICLIEKEFFDLLADEGQL